MRLYELVGCFVLQALGTGCAAPSPPVASRVTSPEVLRAPHVAPDEATIANAGAERCEWLDVFDVASISKDSALALGFGEQGGLVAWSMPAGIHVRPLDERGRLAGIEGAILLPSDAKPIEIAPLGRGFVVIAQRVVTQTKLCEGRCVDATCSGWPAGVAQPHVCTYACPKPCVVPVQHAFFAIYVDLSGKTIGRQNNWQTGLVDVEALLLGDGRSLAILTGSDIVWMQTDEQTGLTLQRQTLPAMQYALPIRGRRKPSLLAVAEDGSLRLLDQQGDHPLRGTIRDARSGRFLDARLQARWDTNDRLHIAKQVWMTSLDSIQYSYVEQGEVHTREEIQRGEFREPFAEYVEPHLENGSFRRGSWIQRAIGEDLDLRGRDPIADVRRARVVWTGKTFLFVYPTSTEPHLLRGIQAACAGSREKPR